MAVWEQEVVRGGSACGFAFQVFAPDGVDDAVERVRVAVRDLAVGQGYRDELSYVPEPAPAFGFGDAGVAYLVETLRQQAAGPDRELLVGPQVGRWVSVFDDSGGEVLSPSVLARQVQMPVVAYATFYRSDMWVQICRPDGHVDEFVASNRGRFDHVPDLARRPSLDLWGEVVAPAHHGEDLHEALGVFYSEIQHCLARFVRLLGIESDPLVPAEGGSVSYLFKVSDRPEDLLVEGPPALERSSGWPWLEASGDRDVRFDSFLMARSRGGAGQGLRVSLELRPSDAPVFVPTTVLVGPEDDAVSYSVTTLDAPDTYEALLTDQTIPAAFAADLPDHGPRKLFYEDLNRRRTFVFGLAGHTHDSGDAILNVGVHLLDESGGALIASFEVRVRSQP